MGKNILTDIQAFSSHVIPMDLLMLRIWVQKKISESLYPLLSNVEIVLRNYTQLFQH